MAKVLLYIYDTSGYFGLSDLVSLANGNTAGYVNSLQNYMGKVFQNPGNAAVQVSSTELAKATGSFTLNSVVATNTCQIGGATFTAVASGATAFQFNVGASDTLTAVNLKNAINTAFPSFFVATSATNVVTLTATDYGAWANGFTLTGSANIVRSAATMTGGVSPSYSLLSGIAFV